eukprot:scaffold124895_cov75-Phaeocystis_antarctica.AAC.1
MRRWRPEQLLPLEGRVFPQPHPRPRHGGPSRLRRRVQPPRLLPGPTGGLHSLLPRPLHRRVDGLRQRDCGGEVVAGVPGYFSNVRPTSCEYSNQGCD